MSTETPSMIRQTIGQEHYPVVCDQCHGRMFIGRELCGKCHGDGRILIPERPAGQRGFLDLFNWFRSK